MQTSELPRAVAAARSIASSLHLSVDEAVVLHDSNKLALRLLPCDVLARVAPVAHQALQSEVELAQGLAGFGCPVAALEPRVEPRAYERDGFVATLWTYYEPVTARQVRPADYANALERPHAGMHKLDLATTHFTDRVGEAQLLVASREPHPGNLLTTKNGLLFIDLETCCRGPVEFDLAHAPEEVSVHYPGLDHVLLRDCRILALAMITAWRWDPRDQLPSGRQLGTEWLSQIRAALGT